MNIDTLIQKRVVRAIMDYQMIAPGDKILVAVSGGKDSMSLVYNLHKMKESHFPIDFDFHCVHIKTDFCNCGKKTRMETYLEKWGVSYEIKQVPVIARLKPGKKMNCYWCSTQRRMELIRSAEEHGCTKIALGHHMDDILETFFMNMSYKGELSTMLPVLQYDKYPFTVIRPLALTKEQDIIKFATKNGLNKLVCTCPYGQKSKRKDMRSIINQMAEGEEYIRDNIYKSLSNPVQRYMMGNFGAANANVSLFGKEEAPLDSVPQEAEEPQDTMAKSINQWLGKQKTQTGETEAADQGKLPCLRGEVCPPGGDCALCEAQA